ncbi:Detected protein of unknown function [Hibiscus syriacus]|uniref:Coenzyme Q-binding protein COQ10 START domain-containing protein n=1 Tax=Hibiscus syriacus TaxID=106335 RepID=A0A6A2ZZK2_HIBSY|nr:Detected protein of unknown function [Hibiscus syriacus]
MSSAAISFVSSPNSLSLTHVFPTKTNPIFSCRVHSFKTQSLRSFFSRIPIGCFKQSSFFTSSNPFSPVMKWQDCSVKMEIDVPASVAYNLYSDREAIPNWMPFVSSVKARNSSISGFYLFLRVYEIWKSLLILGEYINSDEIASRIVLEDKPELSRWFVKYEAFGRSIEYSWLAKNLQPIPNQKIHWTSLEGLGNRYTEYLKLTLF